jgi:hypothetical protein
MLCENSSVTPVPVQKMNHVDETCVCVMDAIGMGVQGFGVHFQTSD